MYVYIIVLCKTKTVLVIWISNHQTKSISKKIFLFRHDRLIMSQQKNLLKLFFQMQIRVQSLGLEVIYSVCCDLVNILTRDSQCFVINQVWNLFYQFQMDKNLSEAFSYWSRTLTWIHGGQTWPPCQWDSNDIITIFKYAGIKLCTFPPNYFWLILKNVK